MGQSPAASAALVLVTTSGHNHLALVKTPSPQHTPSRGMVLNKRETEARRPAPALQMHHELPGCSFTPSTCNRARNCAQLSGVLILRSNHKTSLPPPAASPPTASSFPDITKFSLNKAGVRSSWLRPGLHLPLAPEEPSEGDAPEQLRCKRLSSLKPHNIWALSCKQTSYRDSLSGQTDESVFHNRGAVGTKMGGLQLLPHLHPLLPEQPVTPPQDHSFYFPE